MAAVDNISGAHVAQAAAAVGRGLARVEQIAALNLVEQLARYLLHPPDAGQNDIGPTLVREARELLRRNGRTAAF